MIGTFYLLWFINKNIKIVLLYFYSYVEVKLKIVKKMLNDMSPLINNFEIEIVNLSGDVVFVSSGFLRNDNSNIHEIIYNIIDTIKDPKNKMSWNNVKNIEFSFIVINDNLNKKNILLYNPVLDNVYTDLDINVKNNTKMLIIQELMRFLLKNECYYSKYYPVTYNFINLLVNNKEINLKSINHNYMIKNNKICKYFLRYYFKKYLHSYCDNSYLIHILDKNVNETIINHNQNILLLENTFQII
jgi:hypothetical protein